MHFSEHDQPPAWLPSPDKQGYLRWWNGTGWGLEEITNFSGLFAKRLSKKAANEIIRDLSVRVNDFERFISGNELTQAKETHQSFREELAKAEQILQSKRDELSELERKYATEANNLKTQFTDMSVALERQHETKLASLHQHHEERSAELKDQQRSVEEDVEKRAKIAEKPLLKRQRQLEKQNSRLEKSLEDLERKRALLESQVARAKSELVEVKDEKFLQDVAFFDYEHPAQSSADLATELADVRARIKSAIRNKDTITAARGFTFNNSVSQGKKFVNALSRLMLRAYNSEAENAVKATRHGNLETIQSRLTRAKEQIAKNGQMISLEIRSSFHRLRLKEIELAYKHLRTVKLEKDLERERRAELREQQRAEKELQREQERLEKERAHCEATLEALRRNQDEEGIQRLQEKIADVDKAIHDVDYRKANMRAGYVYVISNKGSFGDNIVKIGMTRRLNPMDRVRELGDASVPFRFDVHALFFADDAVGIENMLHKAFAEQRVNQVNRRREYFETTPQEVLEKLKEQQVEIVEFTVDAEAEEWTESLKIRKQLAEQV